MKSNQPIEIEKWYELLGNLKPEESANYELENDTNQHSFQLFLRGAWREIMANVSDPDEQHEALFALCHYLSDQSSAFKDMPVSEDQQKQWAVFEIDDQGNPLKRLDGLHYYMEDSRP